MPLSEVPEPSSPRLAVFPLLHKRTAPAKARGLQSALPAQCHPPPHPQTHRLRPPEWLHRPGFLPPKSPARQSPGGRAGTCQPRDPGRRALTRASSRATPVPPLPPALAAGQLAARVLEERVREEMKWLLPPVAPGSAPVPGPGPGPGDLDPRRRRELLRVFTMIQPGGTGPAAPGRAEEGWPAGPGSQGQREPKPGRGWGEPSRSGLCGAQTRTEESRTEQGQSAKEGGRLEAGAMPQGRRQSPSAAFALLSSGHRAEPPLLPLSLSFSQPSSVRQGSGGAAGPTRPLPAVATAGRCEDGQPPPLGSLSLLGPGSARPRP